MKFNPLESGDCYFFCVCVVSVFRYYIVWDKSVHLYGDLCVVIRLFSPVFFFRFIQKTLQIESTNDYH